MTIQKKLLPETHSLRLTLCSLYYLNITEYHGFLRLLIACVSEIQLLSLSNLFVIFIMCWFRTTVEIIVLGKNAQTRALLTI